MSKKHSQNPRSIRVRRDLRAALRGLLKHKPYVKITITDIAQQAELARHTFYNHYETKDQLLDDLIDSIMDGFFTQVVRSGLMSNDSATAPRIGQLFFEVWQENAEVVDLLSTVNLDYLLIKRFKVFFAELYELNQASRFPGATEAMGRYIVNHNAYTLVAILRQWFDDDMRYPPEVMGEFLYQFAGIGAKWELAEHFNDVLK